MGDVVRDCQDVLQRTVVFLREEPCPSYLVGGYVRDRLLQQPPRDIDVAVAGDAIGLARRLANATGGAFYVLDEATEAARIVYGTAADGCVVDVAAMRGPDIVADLRDRDLTINAMAIDVAHCSLADPPIIDPCAGQRDVQGKVVRATGAQAFRRDPVRLLRALRFAATLDFRLEPQTEAWIRRDASALSETSAERKRDEFVQMIAANAAAVHLRRLDELGLLEHVFPEVLRLKGVVQPLPHIYDVYEHSLAAVAEVERLVAWPDAKLGADEKEFLFPYASTLASHFGQVVAEGRRRSTLLKMCALLHDVGKPQVLAEGAGEARRAVRHAKLSAEMAAQALQRLRFTVREIRLASTIIGQHMRPGLLLKSGALNRRDIYCFFRDTGDAGVDVLMHALADQLATRGPMLARQHWRDYLALTGELLEHYYHKPQVAVSPPVLVTGQDVMWALGIEPGPRVGCLLEAVREAQADGLVQTKDEAIAFLRSCS